MKRSRVIAWGGTGVQELFPVEPETDGDMNEAAPETESEAQETEQEERKGPVPGDSEASTAATRIRRKDNPIIAPFLYTTMLNQREDLLFAGGSGKNEMRIFDFDSGSLVAMIGNLPKSILCGALANTSDQFAFGSADSRVRIFDINESNGSVMSESQSAASMSMGSRVRQR